MLWQGRHPQNLCSPTPFYCLLSNIYTRWCDSMQSTALAWIGSLELPMQSFCTHLPLPQTTSLVQLPAAVICEIPFKFGTYVRNRMQRTLSRTWVSTWICLLLGYINLLAIPCPFLLRRWRRSVTQKDRWYSLLFKWKICSVLSGKYQQQTHLTHNSPCTYTGSRTAGQMGNDNSLQKNGVPARSSGKLGRRQKV